MKLIKFIKDTYLAFLLTPILFLVLGAASNQVVLIANHAKFPVMVNAERAAKADQNEMLDSEHCLMTHSTHLNALADIFQFGNETWSIGDIFLEAGVDLAPYSATVWFVLILLAKIRG